MVGQNESQRAGEKSVRSIDFCECISFESVKECPAQATRPKKSMIHKSIERMLKEAGEFHL
jgi:hypothetical protein